jgi:voltage-gated potassium channel
MNKPLDTPKLGLRDLLILALSIYVLSALVIETLLPVTQSTRALLSAGDTAACVVFLADFFINFWRADDKRRFMKWGWIDLVSSIPTVGFARWGRAVRVFRLVRLLRGVRAGREIVTLFRRNRSEATALSGMFVAFLTVILSSIAILQVETTAAANIKGPGDALWWSITTMTTVGYGDRYPTTTEGRVIAGVLMIIGVGLFGILTGLWASWLVKPESPLPAATIRELESQIGLLRAENTRLRATHSQDQVSTGHLSQM